MIADLRLAVRALRRSPGFTTAAVLTLALGIGANTAIFSVVDGVLLRPAPFEAIDRLAMVWETDRSTGTIREPASVPDYLDFKQRAGSFAQLAAFGGQEVNLTSETGDPVRLAGLATSHEFLPMVGIQPLIGRTFTPAEDAPGPLTAVLISEDLWTRDFQRDPNVLGKVIRLDDTPVPIVGVLPQSADFGTLQVLSAAAYSRSFADRGGRVAVDVWLPLRANPVSSPRSTHPIFVMGRLAEGATHPAAQDEMTRLMAGLERNFPENVNRGAFTEPLADVVFGPVRTALLVLFGSVGLVLLVACVNVANLMLARGAARMHEVTVRTALGAGTGSLARQFLAESAVLAVVGAGLGMFLAAAGLEVLVALAPPSLPRIDAVTIDARVLLITLLATVVVGLGFSLIPLIQARRADLQQALQSGAGKGSSSGPVQGRFRRALVVTELALAVMLMIGAGLLIRTLANLQQVDPGFRVSGVSKAEYQLPASRYPRNFAVWPNWVEVQRFNTRLQERIEAFPGVEAVALAGEHPINPGFQNGFIVVGREAEAAGWPEISTRRVSPQYFDVLGTALLEGRLIGASDDAAAPPVLLINETARRMFFQGHQPVGQQIRIWGSNRTIVGVITSERIHGLLRDAPPAVYLPLAQAPSANGSYTLIVRHAGAHDALVPSIRAAARQLDPALPLYGIEPLDRTVSHTVGRQRFTMTILSVFAVVALVLAAIGVHGVLSYAVEQRRREIGIRMALGADAQAVRTLVVGQGAVLAAAGLGLGILGALFLARSLTGLLFGVTTRDPATFAAVTISLGLVALLASYLPARRAGLLDPMAALRTE